VSKLQDIGFLLLRYGLVLVIVWIGAMKATEYEARNIERLIAHSPLLSWGYSIWTVRQFSVVIGAAELIIATLITVRHWSPRAPSLHARQPSKLARVLIPRFGEHSSSRSHA
jgi:uncharacterized membrane protein YkgB